MRSITFAVALVLLSTSCRAPDAESPVSPHPGPGSYGFVDLGAGGITWVSVWTEDGAPIEEVQAEFRWKDPDGPIPTLPANPLRLPPEFTIRGLRDRPADLYLNVYGYRVVRLAPEDLLLPSDQGPYEAAIVLERGLAISGRVLGAAGNPVANTCVHVNRRKDEVANLPFFCRHGFTAEDGTFTVSGIEPGSYQVRVNLFREGSRITTTVVLDVPAGGTGVVLRLPEN